MSTAQISEQIRSHIRDACPPERRDAVFTDSSSLVATGVLDSVGVFTLVAFLEEHYGIEVSDEELAWKTFETVEGIAGLVESKLAGTELDRT